MLLGRNCGEFANAAVRGSIEDLVSVGFFGLPMQLDFHHLGQVLSQHHPAAQSGAILFATLSGAHLYGFASEDSDCDIRGVHVTPLCQLLALQPPSETLTVMHCSGNLELDLVAHEVRKFIRMLLKRNGYVLEQLLSPLVIASGTWHQELLALSPRLLTKGHHLHYVGFSQNEWKAFHAKGQWRVKHLLYIFVRCLRASTSCAREPYRPTCKSSTTSSGCLGFRT